MRRGTRVGQAYVAVTADGSGINDEIVDSVDDAGNDIGRVGERHGERYGDSFSDGFFSRLRNKFSKRIGVELSGDMDRAGGEAGDRMGSAMGSAMIQRLRERLEEADDVVRRLSERLDTALGKRTSVGKLNVMENQLRTSERAAERLERQLRAVMVAEGLLGAGIAANGRRKGGLADLFGSAFGKGSRNNFLNFIGSRVKNIVTLTEMASRFAGTFAANMQKAGEGASLFAKLGAGFGGIGASGGSGMGGLGAAAAAAAPALAAVLVTMSALASAAGALIAIVTALASTIVSALVGALAVLGTAFAAAAAGAGLLTAAFMSMTDAQQRLLADAFKPLKAEMVGIGQIMLNDMVPAFKTWSENLQQALLLAVPVAQVMGKAFAEAGNTITKSFSGPGFQAFAQALTVWLPSITTRLSSALGGFLNGLLGVFAALMPLVNRFAGYLDQVATRFSTWANSAAGQNAIVEFADRAVVALKSLWDATTSIMGFIGDLLFSPQAQAAGNTIFDNISETFDRFRQKIAEAAANGDLKKWFDDAIKFGSQLWSVIEALGGTFMSLYNSGVLSAVGKAMETFANILNAANVLLTPLINALGKGLPAAMQLTLGPLNLTAQAIIKIGESIQWVAEMVGIATSQIKQGTAVATSKGIADLLGQTIGVTGSELLGGGGMQFPSMPDLSSLISSGNAALNATSISSGGYKPPKKWKNPWKKWAESLIKDGPKVAAQIRNAVLTVNRQAAAGILSASRSSDTGGVQASLQSLSSSITTTATQTVNTAQSALNSAASSLANATSKGAAKKALKQVKRAQKDLAAALKNQKRINAAAKIINAQRVVTSSNVSKLLSGLAVQNATLADYATARGRVATMLDDANEKLTEALSIRDEYKNQVAESIKDFGSLLTTQASVIDGVEQALTASDITTNLQARLDKIKTFQNNLRLLLAQGLSNDAYKQIVDAGVDQGSTLATALLGGGNGAIQNVNSLVGQINSIADTIGTETSSRMYQAGVDAAKGLVDGLTSLSAQLDSAALRLGNSIALAVKRSLGIASPSRVLFRMMDDVGDGAALGLDNQHVKVGSAAARLAGAIAVSPAAASAAGRAVAEGVSGNGNDPRFRDLIVQTPTEDPHAVAMEVLNEVTGRI